MYCVVAVLLYCMLLYPPSTNCPFYSYIRRHARPHTAAGSPVGRGVCQGPGGDEICCRTGVSYEQLITIIATVSCTSHAILTPQPCIFVTVYFLSVRPCVLIPNPIFPIPPQVNSASRTEVSAGYFDQMRRARIIVTSNPSDWEGDFR